MKSYYEKLKAHIESNPSNLGDGESVLAMLYECYNESNPYDIEHIRADFNDLYQQMNEMSLRKMDKIIFPVCRLCRDHERSGFIKSAFCSGRTDRGTRKPINLMESQC